MKIEEMIKQMVEEIENYREKIEENRIKQKRVWKNKKTEIPIILSVEKDEFKNFPDFNLKEQFYDPEKMLYMQLKGIINSISNYSDAVPSVRFNFGTGFIPSIFGIESEIFEDKMPWIKKHLPKEEIKNLKISNFSDIENLGLMQKVRSYLEVYQKYLKDRSIKIYLPDTQGPFDIAHLVRGEDIFTDIYDDFEFLKNLLEICTYIYIQATKKLKELIGEDLYTCFHSGVFYVGKGGVRICEDSTTLISSKHIEIVMEYTKKCLKEFAGGWIHFCGKAEHLLEAVLEIPEATGINLGNPEKYNFEELFKKFNEKNKIYIGSIPKRKDENWKDYLKWVYEICEGKNLIFIAGINEERIEEIYDYWQNIQK